MKKIEKKNKTNRKLSGFFRTLVASSAATLAMTGLMSVVASATGFDTVTVTATGDQDAGTLMGKIIGILLTITRFVGVALVVYGVYEIVMSFMQNQPEAKTKGIIMALAGVVMIALKSILKGLNIVA